MILPRGPQPPPGEVLDHRRGEVLGRYLILDRVGGGGMGVVYAAYDPQLERKVAIKVLRADALAGSDGEEGGGRLLREAQAMAKLSHPNVLPVFDVGTVGEEVFIAAEFVDGCTLAQWTVERMRSWREVLHCFLAAGRGLAAAHALGIVHLDFKPSNVMVGKDGSVRVMDFGLAQRSGDPESVVEGVTPTESEETNRAAGSSSRTDVAVGTPRYMAPEQHLGLAVDSAADQYAFCVSLYRALYGRFPFAESRGQKLVEAKQQKRLASFDPGRRVPGWLRRVLLRGLEPDPARRWPSMGDLLDTLARDPRRQTARAVAATLLLTGALTGGWAYGKVQENRDALCSGAPLKLAGVWDAQMQDRVQKAFLATDAPHARETWDHLKPALDSYTQAWMTMYTDACQATHVRQEQSEAILDLRMGCLHTRLRDLEAVIKLFAIADARTVQRAVTAAGSLQGIDRCGQLDRLQNDVAPPTEDQKPQVERLEQELTDVRALIATGKHPEALPRAEKLLERAKMLGYVPLIAQVQYVWGVSMEGLGNYEAAAESFAETGWLAEGHGMDEVTFQAQSNRIMMAMRMGRFEEALHWGRHAQATVARLGSEPEFEAPLHHALGAVYDAQRRFDEARKHWEYALEARLRVKNGDPLAVAMHHGMLAVIASEQRRFEDAAEHYEKDYEISVAKLGPNHPRIGILFLNMGATAHDQAKYDQSRAHFERAYDIFAPSVGAGHPYAAKATDGVARVLVHQGQFEAAAALLRKSITAMKERPKPDYPTLTESILLLGSTLISAGDLEEAAEVVSEARALVDAHWSTDATMTARYLALEGRLQAADGQQTMRVVTTLRRALEAVAQAKGSHEKFVATLRVDLARALRIAQQGPEAISVLDSVFAMAAQIERPTLADAHFELAQAVLATDRHRAQTHAETALQIYDSLGDTAIARRQAIVDWTRANDL